MGGPSGISLQAHLVVDNCVLVMLHEYCCERYAKRLPAGRLIPTITQWITDQLDILKQFTPDGLVHCTDCVVNSICEFFRTPGSMTWDS